MRVYLLLLQSFFLSVAVSSQKCDKGTKCHQLDPQKKNSTINVTTSERDQWNIFCFKGQNQSLLLFWSNVLLKVSFKENSEPGYFHVVNGDNLEEVEERKQNSNTFLRLLQKLNLLIKKEGEGLPFKPFNTSCIGVETDVSYTASLSVKLIELWFVAYLLAGIVIFFSAKSWSQNTSLHYGTGVTVGVMASLLILVFVLYRLFPKSLKTAAYVFLAAGWSTSFWLLTGFINRLFNPVTDIVVDYWKWILGYMITTGLISFGICYKYGPVTDPKTLNLVQWLLQCLALVLVYNGTQIKELSFALIIIILTVYNFPRRLLSNRFTRYFRYTLFPPKPRLLTEEEYQIQGHEETRKALEELRSFCKSPDCNPWQTISRLKHPDRFAQFIEGNSWHVTDDELLEYDSGPEPTPPDDQYDELDNESDMEFQLNSP